MNNARSISSVVITTSVFVEEGVSNAVLILTAELAQNVMEEFVPNQTNVALSLNVLNVMTAFKEAVFHGNAVLILIVDLAHNAMEEFVLNQMNVALILNVLNVMIAFKEAVFHGNAVKIPTVQPVLNVMKELVLHHWNAVMIIFVPVELHPSAMKEAARSGNAAKMLIVELAQIAMN